MLILFFILCFIKLSPENVFKQGMITVFSKHKIWLKAFSNEDYVLFAGGIFDNHYAGVALKWKRPEQKLLKVSSEQ